MLRRVALPSLLLLAFLALPATAMAHGDTAPVPTFPGVLLAWSPDPVPLLGVLITGELYIWAARRVSARRRTPHPRWRTAAFLAGLLAIVLALNSPIERYEGALFSVHMVQHMLLMLAAAPLLLLGAPGTLALRAASPAIRRTLLRLLHSRVMAVISFPLLGWMAFAAVNWGWHFSPLYNQALENDALHYLEHAVFMAAALLFWWPIVGADPSRWRLPYPARLFYLFLAMPQNSFLGVAIMSAGSVLYPHYLDNFRPWGPSVLGDQQVGGILMWVGGDMTFLIAMGLVVAAWVRQEDRRTARMDARLDAEARLAEAAAGQADAGNP